MNPKRVPVSMPAPPTGYGDFLLEIIPAQAGMTNEKFVIFLIFDIK